MVSLSILLGIFFASLLLMAWALALTARVVGSSCPRMRVGMLATGLILLVQLATAGLGAMVPAAPVLRMVLVSLALLAVQLWLVFTIIRRMFRLPPRQTFAPFAVYIGLIVLQVPLALLVIKPFLTEAFVLPSGGMAPTLQPDDRFLANKVVHPQRWDIIVYRVSGMNAPAIYCQRLIGLPGERLRFEQGQLYVNDQAVCPPAVLAGRCHAQPSTRPAPRAQYRDGETIVLGSDEYFLIGDNVDSSVDSRMNGPSPGSSIIGVVDMVYWPLGRAQVIR